MNAIEQNNLCSNYFDEAKEALKDKHYAKVLDLLKYVIKYFPDNQNANYLYGDTCLKVGDHINAIKYIQKTKDKFKDELFYNVSLAKCYEFTNLEKSELLYKKILSLSKNHFTSIEMIAFFYQYKKKDFKLAEHYFLLGLQIYGNKYSFTYNLGILYQDYKLYDKAIEFYNLAIKNNNNLHSIYNNLGNCFLHTNKKSLAVLMFKKSIQSEPKLSSAYINLGALYKSNKRYNSALWVYENGLNSIKNKHILWQMSLLKILMGDFKNGFELYETRLSLNKFKNLLPSIQGKRWQRENIKNKTLLISAEQGLGDIIFFARYIKYVLLLEPRKVIILAPKELGTLLNMDKKIEIILKYNKSIKYDYYCYIMSLAYLFYENGTKIPNQTPYLTPNKKSIDVNIEKEKFNVFLFWHTSSDGDDAHKRNIDLSLLDVLLEINNIQFYSMTNTNIERFNINNVANKINDFNDTAIILKKMDLVICIDTAIAHLAGALNISTLVILPYDSNWRWGIDDKYVDYYPSIKLFRGNKKYAFKKICLEIKISIEDIIKNEIKLNNHTNNTNHINIDNVIKDNENVKNLNDKAISYLYNQEYNKVLNYSMQSISIYKNPIAFMNIGVTYLKQNELQKALWHLLESIFMQENDETYFHLGVCFLKLKKSEQSIEAFKNSIKINPLNIRSKHNLGFIYAQNNMNLKAIDVNLDILNIDPLNTKALESISTLYGIKPDYENARKYYKILETKNDISSIGKLNMATFYFTDNQLNKSKKLLNELLKSNSYLEKSHQLLGNIYKREFKIDKAISHYHKSIELNKNDKTLIWNLGFLYLSKGDYLKGFSFIEKRYETKLLAKKKFLKSVKYNNEDLNNKTLFIYMEQGFGDNILLARYIKLIKSKYPNSTLYLSSRKELFTLFKKIKYIDKIFDIDDIKEDYDYYISLFSMPFIFKTTINTIPNIFPYLSPEAKNIDIYLDNNLINIGIAWESGDVSTNKEERSINITNFNTLSKSKKVKLYSLQKGDASKDIEKNSMQIEDLSHKIKDFNDTANIILKLDLIISVDTALAHLSGALNVKCLVILPEDTNWRWGLSGDKSPWFDSIKLFRMKKNKDIKNLFIDMEKFIFAN